VERTARIHRRSFDHSGICPTSMASVQAQERARDKLAVHSILYRGHRFLAVLWDSDRTATANHMECHNLCPGMGYVICQAKIWQMIPIGTRLRLLIQPAVPGQACPLDFLPKPPRSCRIGNIATLETVPLEDVLQLFVACWNKNLDRPDTSLI
jgi:hypothetical protein